MKLLWIASLTCTIIGKFSKGQEVNLTFPENFQFGVATSSYQVEGAWNVSDKGENVWDWWTHTNPTNVIDLSNGDVACDGYHKYKEDVQWIKTMGFNFYRFSISWSRILPNGFANEVSQEGLQYYKDLIEELQANDIEPCVTIYHWDHPQVLEELGGWTNELMVDWFLDYARIIFEELGPLVKLFITVNEPQMLCKNAYNNTIHAPGKVLENMGHYICMHNMLKAHAKAYHMYDDEFRSVQGGEIGTTVPCNGWVESDQTNDTVVDQFFQFGCGWPMHPIVHGDYPEIMKTRIALISELEGYPFSRLPEFSQEWIDYIKGTYDFFGLNHYSSYRVEADPDEEIGIYNSDDGIITSHNESWSIGSLSWMRVVPEGFGNLLRKIRDEYNNPLVYIFENGYSDLGELDDYERITYYYGYLRELLTAIKDDGCNVQRYTAWSLLDNFEWAFGYTVSFGLVSVNFTDPERTRTAKLSTYWWQSITEQHTLQEIPANNSRRT